MYSFDNKTKTIGRCRVENGTEPETHDNTHKKPTWSPDRVVIDLIKLIYEQFIFDAKNVFTYLDSIVTYIYTHSTILTNQIWFAQFLDNNNFRSPRVIPVRLKHWIYIIHVSKKNQITYIMFHCILLCRSWCIIKKTASTRAYRMHLHTLYCFFYCVLNYLEHVLIWIRSRCSVSTFCFSKREKK